MLTPDCQGYGEMALDAIPPSRPCREQNRSVEEAADADVTLAQQLYAEWQGGKPKSRIERETWGDGSSHGRRLDRFINVTLGLSTRKRSKQSARIDELEIQVRSLGRQPVGRIPVSWEVQLQHGREACMGALRTWNDPSADFRTGTFSTLLVVAWNSVSIALVDRAGGEWLDLSGGKSDYARDIMDLVDEAFGDEAQRGLRENVRFFVDIRNAVAHRHLPELDTLVIPEAQASLLNFEQAIVQNFGEEYGLAGRLSVPLQLSGFRDPQLLKSLRQLQSSLPIDIQTLLARAESANPDLISDPTFQLRVAFVPVVPASGRSPDSVAYFVKPGEVPTELSESLSQYVVVPKAMHGQRPTYGAKHVVSEVRRRTSTAFTLADHLAAARHFGVRPERGAEERTIDELFAEYFSAFKNYLYTQRWIDRLVKEIADADTYENAFDRPLATPFRSRLLNTTVPPPR